MSSNAIGVPAPNQANATLPPFSSNLGDHMRAEFSRDEAGNEVWKVTVYGTSPEDCAARAAGQLNRDIVGSMSEADSFRRYYDGGDWEKQNRSPFFVPEANIMPPVPTDTPYHESKDSEVPYLLIEEDGKLMKAIPQQGDSE